MCVNYNSYANDYLIRYIINIYITDINNMQTGVDWELTLSYSYINYTCYGIISTMYNV